MNKIQIPASSHASRVLVGALAGLILGAAAVVAAEPALENFVEFAGAGSSVSGDKASFQKLTNQNKDGYGGLSGFHFGKDVGKGMTLTADGHALGGNNDFKLDLRLTKEDVGFVSIGYLNYRVWYDGSGGFIPGVTGGWQPLYSDDLHIDRSNFWIEAGLTPPDKVHFNLRYDYTEREGTKDSTSWGDVTLGSLGARAIVPTYLDIKETRHVVNAKVSQDTEQTNWEVSGRYESTKQDNSRNMHRSVGSTADRYVTQDDVADNDMFMVRGSVETKIGETLTMSTGMAHYSLDTNIEGSRIYGSSGYDPVFSTTYARRQYHDEGFINLEGNGNMSQTLANINVMYTPSEVWTIVPSLLAEKTSWTMKDEYAETNVGAPPGLAMAVDDIRGSSDRTFTNLTGMVEARYTGIKNVVFNATAEANKGDGMMDEQMLEAELGEVAIARGTDYTRDGQKIALTGHWYARPGLNFTAQYYFKAKQNGFVTTHNTVSPTSGDRYPGYITHQDLETNDFNIRATWAPLMNVRTVSRYDYQETDIRTQVIALAFIDTGKVKSHVLSETITWNPLDRLYLQAAGSVVYDQTTTPVKAIGGNIGGAVLNSDNNYVSADLSAGYVLDEKTDLTGTYSYYRANNYVDNSAFSVPYGAGATYQTVGLQMNHRVSPQLSYLVKYAYGDSEDVTSGGNNNFHAHTIYGRVQYRF